MTFDLTKPIESSFSLGNGHSVWISTTARDTEIRDNTSGRIVWLPRIGNLTREMVVRATDRVGVAPVADEDQTQRADVCIHAKPEVIDRVWGLVEWLQNNSK
jgi:hypothetical protein